MHNCPRCGQATDGTWSEGGFKWAICEECMEQEFAKRPLSEERKEEECDYIK
jgi:hypothetical protein